MVEISTELGPYELLQLTQKAEELSGRERKYHWAPRRLDIDILLIEGLVLDDPRLTVPHPLMKQRLFVLQPLAEIARFRMGKSCLISFAVLAENRKSNF